MGCSRTPAAVRVMEAFPEHRLSPEDTFEETVRMFDQLAVEYLYVLTRRDVCKAS